MTIIPNAPDSPAELLGCPPWCNAEHEDDGGGEWYHEDDGRTVRTDEDACFVVKLSQNGYATGRPFIELHCTTSPLREGLVGMLALLDANEAAALGQALLDEAAKAAGRG